MSDIDVHPCDHCLFNTVEGDWKQPLGDGMVVGKMCVKCCEDRLEEMGVHPRIQARMIQVLVRRRLKGSRQPA